MKTSIPYTTVGADRPLDPATEKLFPLKTPLVHEGELFYQILVQNRLDHSTCVYFTFDHWAKGVYLFPTGVVYVACERTV